MRRTSSTPRHIRHGLTVLLQHSLVYWTEESGTVAYDGNTAAAYALLRSGKIVEMVSKEYGPAAKHLVQNLLNLGHTRVADLIDAFEGSLDKRPAVATTNGRAEAGDEPEPAHKDFTFASRDEVVLTLSKLVAGEIVEVVRPKSFQYPADVEAEVTARAAREFAPKGKSKSATKDRAHIESKAVEKLRELRAQPTSLKRKMGYQNSLAAKRQKLTHEEGVNGTSFLAARPFLDVSPPRRLLVLIECPRSLLMRPSPTSLSASITKSAWLNFATTHSRDTPANISIRPRARSISRSFVCSPTTCLVASATSAWTRRRAKKAQSASTGDLMFLPNKFLHK